MNSSDSGNNSESSAIKKFKGLLHKCYFSFLNLK